MEDSQDGCDMFLLDDSVLYEPDQNSQGDSSSLDALSITCDDLGPESEQFDWLDAVPAHGWTPQTLSMSSQSPSCGSVTMSISPASSKSSSRTRVPGNPASLLLPSLEAASGAGCGCRFGSVGKSCMSTFNIGDIFRLRYERSRLSYSEAMARRTSDLLQGVGNGGKQCRLQVEGHMICLQAYCMLYNLNWSFMR